MSDDDTNAPSAPRGVLGPIVAGFNALGSIWIIGLMLILCADIVMRSFFNAPIRGVAEMVSFSIVGIVFLQLAHTLRTGSLTRSEMLLNLLETRAPALHRALLALFNLIGAALLGLALWYFLPSLVDAWTRPERNFMGNPGVFRISTWPLYALMALGMAATIAQFLASAWSALREGRG